MAEREHRGVHQVVDVAQAGDGATAIDEEHVAAAHRTRDLSTTLVERGP